MTSGVRARHGGTPAEGLTAFMTDFQELLVTATAGRGVAACSVIASAGAEPQSCHVPELQREPSFLAYSITKTFTAALLLRLCEAGRLGLEDPLARWFPDITSARHIPLRRLLNHTGGIPDYGPLRAYHNAVRVSPSVPWSFERFAEETFGKGLLFDPGQGWAYSNPGYMLLKRIVEETAGASFRALVAELIAAPLGLERTFVPESVQDLAGLAPASSTFLSPDGTPRDVRTHYHPGWVSHGVVASTPSEIVRFVSGLFQGRFLSPVWLAAMTELVDIDAGAASGERDPGRRWVRPGYGLGLMGDPASPWGLTLGHDGGGPGYSTSVFHAPSLGVTACVMAAIEADFNAEDVVFGIFDALADALAERGDARHRH